MNRTNILYAYLIHGNLKSVFTGDGTKNLIGDVIPSGMDSLINPVNRCRKAVLRSLRDLDKPLDELNGKSFISSLEVTSGEGGVTEFSRYNASETATLKSIRDNYDVPTLVNQLMDTLPHGIVSKLIQLKFDIGSLIVLGEAEDASDHGLLNKYQ